MSYSLARDRRPTARLLTGRLSEGRLHLVLCVIVLLVSGCASMPDVESRLRGLQFHANMYVAQAGDSLESIAYRYGLSPAELAALNPGVNSRVYPGLRMNVRPGTDLPQAVRSRQAEQWNEPTRVAAVEQSMEQSAYDAAGRTPQQAVIVSPAPARAQAPRPQSTQSSLQPRSTLAAVDPEPRPRWRPEPLVPVNPFDGGELAVESNADARLARADPDVWRQETSWPKEEIVPDDFDELPAARTSRETMDGELARYVGSWSWPTDGAIARGFAPERAGGQGVDIAGVPGQDVRAALDGTVIYSGRDLSGGGNLVIVRHDDDLMTTYSHTDELFVAEDDRVRAGDPIASLGWNAERESVLRFEVRRDGSPLDPLDYLPTR